MHEGPNGPIIHLEASVAEFGDKAPQGEVRLDNPLPKKGGVFAHQDARPGYFVCPFTPTNVRFAPLTTKMLQRRECSDVPITDVPGRLHEFDY